MVAFDHIPERIEHSILGCLRREEVISTTSTHRIELFIEKIAHIADCIAQTARFTLRHDCCLPAQVVYFL